MSSKTDVTHMRTNHSPVSLNGGVIKKLLMVLSKRFFFQIFKKLFRGFKKPETKAVLDHPSSVFYTEKSFGILGNLNQICIEITLF